MIAHLTARTRIPLVLGAAAMVLAGCAAAAQTIEPQATPLRSTTTTTVATNTKATSTTTSTSTPTTSTTATSSTTTIPAPKLRTPTRQAPLRAVVLGDSTAYSVGWAMVRADHAHLLSTDVRSKTSSGLSRPDFFDWPRVLTWLPETDPPDVIIVSMGANDAQPLVAPDGTHHDVGTDGWFAEYRRRVERVNRQMTATGARVYWVSQPQARDADYTQSMQALNGIYRDVSKADDHVAFVDIWPAISKHGGYTDALSGPDGKPVVIRQEDGIHLTDGGGDLVARLIMKRLRVDWGG